MLVSAIIPAYNARAYLGRTLISARAQTYADLEIIIVDDGSTDGTGDIAELASKVDKRIRVVHQENAGVAAARNRGLAEARGDYVAPLDADDMWNPQYLALQMESINAAGPETAVSYAWYVAIDEHDKIIDTGPPSVFRERRRVLSALIESNFIGNGSCVLMRRRAVESVGCYDTSLHARGAQGSEDEALYLALAERWNFSVVPQYVVAYRHHAESMSQDHLQMARSQALAITDLRRRRPDLSAYRFGRGLASVHEGALMAALRNSEWNELTDVLSRARQVGGFWCILDLIGRRLIKRSLEHCVRKLQRGVNRKTDDTVSNVYWPIDAGLKTIVDDPRLLADSEYQST